MSTNEKPFTLQVFLPHKTTTGVVLEGFGVRVSATRSSVRAAVEDALKEWHQRVLDPLTKAARTTRAKLAQETMFPGPPAAVEPEEAPAGPLPDAASSGFLFPHVSSGPRITGISIPLNDGSISTAAAEGGTATTEPARPVLGVPFEP